jgi:methylated-DNA-[protein]-cysteine S-methyltransferase
MATHGFALFETTIGHCGIAWGEDGVVGVLLPDEDEAALRRQLRAQFPDGREGAPEEPVRRAIDAITALLRGEARDLGAIELDMARVPPFHRRVYEVARTIPPGATLSYGEVAARLGSPGAARAVGQALGKNPFAIVVPCHRVLAAGRKAGGFSAKGGVTTKLRLLAIEGAQVAGAPGLGFDPRAAVEHLRAKDATLGGSIDATGAFTMKLDPKPSVFFALAEAIVHQQLTTKAASTIFGRVRALFPDAAEGFTAEQLLRVDDEALRAAGLSQAKRLALRDLASKVEAGELPTIDEARAMDDEAIVERLTKVRGVGRWTVEMFLIFRLGRPDVLPLDDFGVRKGFAVTYGKSELPTRRELEAHGERWRPYRTVASWYLWRAAERARSSPRGPGEAPERRRPTAPAGSRGAD